MTFSIIPLFVLCQIFGEANTKECKQGEYSIFGMMLRGHTFTKLNTSISFECLQACNDDFRCHSFHYVFSQDVCELNDRTKEARPDDFIPNSERYYFEPNKKRVPIGSIPELPAKTCKEIKASEGGHAVSGKYWFDSIIPGETVLIPCNMETEDADECSASIPVCDVNATCQNTPGSYICICESGLTGDGKTCSDIDECSASARVCDANADCQNTLGSYLCSCKGGFTGDGKTCSDADECSAAVPVCGVNANCQNTHGSFRCSCKDGFTGDGKTCADIDECSASVQVCDVNADCQNTGGSYLCSCKDGFTGDGKTCAVAAASFNAVFTNLAASGRNGPTSLGSHYTGQDHDGQVTLSSGIQQWTVPYTGGYRIEAIGAAGGYGKSSNNGQYRGRGARMIGTFTLSKGDIIHILVGQEGGINSVSNSAGGGGGTFVVKEDNTPLIVAGGGGGMEALNSRQAGCDASTSTTGNPGHKSWSGGSGGQGATTADSSNSGGGGGGFYSSGRSSTQFGGTMGTGGEGGKGFLQGGVGGRSLYNDIDGGFGGGAGPYGMGGGAGGGGGYSGGSSGDNEFESCGGGGGSYNAGANQQNECCYKTAGHGQVTITLL